MVNKDRFIPAILIVTYIAFFYYTSFEYLLIFSLFFFMIYDFVYSKILSLKFSIFIFFLFIVSVIFFGSYTNELQLFLFLFYLITLFCFFILKTYKIFLFVFLNILNFFFIHEVLFANKKLFFIIIILSFINDTIAFLAGRYFKGPLIAPNISPKKTWSGTIISFLTSLTLLLILDFNFLFSILISSSFFIGDLFFSYFKRSINLKDFSNLLLGHGGFLDRFDSIFFATFLLNFYIIFFI